MATTITYQTYVNNILVELGEPTLDSVSAFDAATRFHLLVKKAVNKAITDIAESEMYKWDFLKIDGSQVLTAGDETYDRPSDAIDIDWMSFYIDRDEALTNEDAVKLYDIGINRYERNHLASALNNTLSDQRQKPQFIVRTRGNNFIFGPTKPDEAYTVKFKYFKAPTVLSAAADTTEVPDAFSLVIEETALYYLYKHREEIENMQISKAEAKTKLQRMSEILIPRHNTMTTSG